jgi:hypothetical protein
MFLVSIAAFVVVRKDNTSTMDMIWGGIIARDVSGVVSRYYFRRTVVCRILPNVAKYLEYLP